MNPHPHSSVIATPRPRRRWLAATIAAALVATSLAAAPHAQARVFFSVNIAPPLLPVYEQPPIPGPGYVWVPGYWAYGEFGYYWVPGTWTLAPYRGALWTPAYWGWNNNAYAFHEGYWGLHVGYYGGINYGFGYTGVGYSGGYWNHGAFYYNSAVNRFGNVRITNVYNRTVVNNVTINRSSYNGPGGVRHVATREELAFARERHVGATREQVRQRELASHDEMLRASLNHGTPPLAATPRAGVFEHAGLKERAAATANRVDKREALRAAMSERVRTTGHSGATERATFKAAHAEVRQTRQTQHRALVAEHVRSVHANRGATVAERTRFKEGGARIREQARIGHRAAVAEHVHAVREQPRYGAGPRGGFEHRAMARPAMHERGGFRMERGGGRGAPQGGGPKDRGHNH